MLDETPEITGNALKTWHELGPLTISEIKKKHHSLWLIQRRQALLWWGRC